MRIVASNPDSIGDLVLRQPLYAALLDAGHELLLLVRPPSAALVSLIAASTDFALIPGNPYGQEMLAPGKLLEEVHGRIAAFAPDALLVAPFQWTLFEEHIARRLPPGAQVFGMTGRMYRGELHRGQDWKSDLRFTAQVRVAEDESELVKNQRLAEFVLGRTIALAPPQLTLTTAQKAAANETLRSHGATPGEFILACVGENEWTAVRNWTISNWAATLAHWVRVYNRTIVFAGVGAERAATDAIREQMGDAADRTISLVTDESPIDLLVGVAAAARAYIGRDTGPMHIAAAVGVPVIAVFGGGTWPRFIPAARSGHIATTGVACAGCDWICPLSAASCIKLVPADEIMGAIDALEGGQLTSLRTHVLSPSSPLAAGITRNLRAVTHETQRREAATRVLLAAAEEAKFAAEAQKLDANAQKLVAESRRCEAEAQRAEAEAQRHDVQVRLQQIEAEDEVLRATVAECRDEIAALRATLAEAEQSTARYRGYMQELRQSRWRKLGLRLGIAKRTSWEGSEEPG